MAHMQKQITEKMRGWRVDVRGETWYVPGDVAAVPDVLRLEHPIQRGDWPELFDMLVKHVRDYVGLGDITEVTAVEGYFGRWSAPGYLDCTEWQFSRSVRELRTDLSDD